MNKTVPTIWTVGKWTFLRESHNITRVWYKGVEIDHIKSITINQRARRFPEVIVTTFELDEVSVKPNKHNYDYGVPF